MSHTSHQERDHNAFGPHTPPVGLKTFSGAPWASLPSTPLGDIPPAMRSDGSHLGAAATGNSHTESESCSADPCFAADASTSCLIPVRPLGKPPRPSRSTASRSLNSTPGTTPTRASLQRTPLTRPASLRGADTSSLAGPLSPPRTSGPSTRVVFVATDDPTTLETPWMRQRMAKLAKAMRAVSAGSAPHTRLQEQHDRLARELERRGETPHDGAVC